VAPGTVTVALATAATSPAVMSQGLPEVTHPRKVRICAMTWSPGSATVGAPMALDVARHQKTASRVAAVPAAVPVPCGLLVISTKPAGVDSVIASLADSTKRSAMSLVRCVGHAGETAMVLLTAVPAA
jgi:hypothetical protein